MTERAESDLAELVALDPLEMLLDAARYAEGNGGSGSNPAWAKAARAAVAKARLAAQDQKPCDGCDGHECLDENQKYQCQYPAAAPDHGGADAGVKAQIATLAQRFWTIHPRELQDKGMTREEFYIREMTALVASLSKPAPVTANASAEARIQREQVINSAQTLVDLFSWEPSEETGLEEPHLDKMYPDFYQALTTLKDNLRWVDVEPLEALSAHPHASDCDKQGER